tara:strand:+ start:719 stop:952 length:234 start_codon:yes stop_codon:yes gene_type:complete
VSNKHERPYLKLVRGKDIKPSELEYVEPIVFDRPPRDMKELMHRKGLDLRTITLGLGALCIMSASVIVLLVGFLLAL